LETALKTIINKDWITVLLILSFLILTVSKKIYTQRFQGLLPFLGIEKYNSRIKDKKSLHPFTILLSIHHITILSLFIFLWYTASLGKAYTELPDLYIKILIGYLIFEVVKTLIDKTIGYILNIQGIMQLYLNRKLNFKNLLSILVLILCFFVVYGNFATFQILQVSLWVIICLYFISLAITISKYQDQILSLPFYFILYFCTLEIAPYYILYNMVHK